MVAEPEGRPEQNTERGKRDDCRKCRAETRDQRGATHKGTGDEAEHDQQEIRGEVPAVDSIEAAQAEGSQPNHQSREWSRAKGLQTRFWRKYGMEGNGHTEDGYGQGDEVRVQIAQDKTEER